MRIGERVRELRLEKGITQRAVAEALQIGASHVAHIEAGRAGLSIEQLRAFAILMDKTLDEIMSGVEAEPRAPQD